MQIGIAGTGKMGSAIAKRLLATGHPVVAWNRTRERAQPVLDAGAAWAETPAALASEADLVITMVSDDAALEAVHFGPDGLLAGRVDGRLFIDMSTVAPDTQRSVGRRVLAAGARYLECPVGGSVGPASQGKLLGFAGGDAQDVERARPVLEQLCRRLEHVGGFGAGATMKLAINLPLLVYWQTLSEALSLLQPLGLDPARVVDILADTSGGPNMLKVRGPMIAQALAGRATGEVTVDVATMRKDVRAMLAQADATRYRLPLTSQLLQTLEQAGRAGLDGADCTQVPVWWLAAAGKA
ncbi:MULTISPECIES: NAD(P)-dependent oxidoreductase [Ramlibacter]|uniref:NAD-binding protein n=1 Tax=Ramlibacter pinisoli TaxID=2682844 RepID=A0A6N8IMP6_9BURK|nr:MULTISPECIES: NAD(P)-dependent oxidoreductase [Ramlibacter]MBA2963132.1 NAD(P)-dependent oxidoreductase [Ramlibacter sp. CGMCC 1.13660]MVQ28101.1 NAD-binding protein [Ramlibacter pinisoli]